MSASQPQLANVPKRVICLIHQNKNAPSETFIRNHIDHLPARVIVMYGPGFPAFFGLDHPLIPSNLWRRVGQALSRRIRRAPSLEYKSHALAKFLRKHRVDAVLAEYGQTGAAVMRACGLARVPLVVHFHGRDASGGGPLEATWPMYPELFRSAAAVVAGSNDLKRRLIEIGCPPEKAVLNHHGVDTGLFLPGDPANAPPLFAAVGRFVEKKAPHLTILAFSRVRARVPEARLVMIGGGRLLEACKSLARALCVADAVEFLGPQPPAAVAGLMRRARAFVQHSVRTSDGDAESFGVVFAEAGASGLPCVATRHDGIPEVVLDGETGLLVDEHDVDGMAAAMLRLAEDPPLAGKLGRQARERVCTHFTLEKSIAGLMRIIEEAIGQPRPSRD